MTDQRDTMLGDMAEKTKTNPKGAGAPARVPGVKSGLVAIRLTPDERDQYTAAAKTSGLKLGEWIRAACEAWLKRSTKRGK